jgi:hypothetical protein
MAILVVVLGHWLMAIVYFDGSTFSGASALDVVPATWVLTWVLQVMPLFFFVGGFSNFTSWRAERRKGGGYYSFISARLERLLAPTLVFIGIWVAAAMTVELAAPELAAKLQPALAIIAKPLWFIAVYVIVVALAPTMLKVHERHGWRVPVAMTLAAVVVDLCRLSLDLPLIGYLNFAFVWLFAHQLGFFYADGRLAMVSRRWLVAICLAAVGLLVALTTVGPYARSMVGAEGGGVSNNSPPSICIIVLSTWLIAAAMLLRPRATAWLERSRNWKVVIAANSMIMTIFLWHLTALLVAVVIAFPLGFPQPLGGSAAWWALRPMWMAVLVVALVPFVLLLGRFERPRRGTRVKATGSAFRAASAVGVVTAGMAGFATAGFSHVLSAGGPLANAALVGAGAHLLGRRSRNRV